MRDLPLIKYNPEEPLDVRSHLSKWCTLFFAVFFLFAQKGYTQINLVPNPSFEDTIYCPALPSPNIADAKWWREYRGTPDYFHPCANSSPLYPNNQPVFGVPANMGGFQQARHGVAYGGLYTFAGNFGSSQREFMGTILDSFLTPGVTYYFSCYVSNGDSMESNSATNNFGMKLSTIPYDGTPGYSMAITNSGIIKFDTIMNEKNHWVRLSGSFVADSAYRFLAIGNFYDDWQTQVDSTPGTVPLAYYYVDAVCLTSDSVYNETWTGEKAIDVDRSPLIFPNPAAEHFEFFNERKWTTLTMTDLAGRLVRKWKIKSGINRIPIEDINDGMYILIFDDETSTRMVIRKH